jgi:dTDP-4-amino-4,6-dideoxygalactose transaminase
MSVSSGKQIRRPGERELSFIKEVVERGQLSWLEDGMAGRFEKAFAQFTGAQYGIARANAMVALAEAVSVSGAGPGYEVICDPIVHFGALAAAYFNAVPRFADVDYGTYNMTPESLEANITERTKAVIVTHLWGLPAEIDRIAEICNKHGLFLIEDCAHAIGATWKGRHVGIFGNIGCFSFQEYKHLSTGDGGMSITDDGGLQDKLKNVWAFSGESPHFMYLNFRMTELTAAVGMAELEKIQDRIDSLYNKTLELFNEVIEDCNWLKSRVVPKEATQTGYWFACTWEGDKHSLDYDRFKKLSKNLGLDLNFGFNQLPAYQFDLFKNPTLYKHSHCPTRCPFYTEVSDYRYTEGLCPVTEDLMPRLVTLGLIFLTVEDAEKKAEMLRKLIKKMEI